MSIDLKAEDLLTQYRQSKDLEIEQLLSQYGDSLKDVRAMYPQLTTAVKQRQLTTALPTQPLFFTPSEAQDMGLQLQEGWMLKMTPAGEGYTSSLVTPQKWEITESGNYISPTGETYSQADLRALLSTPIGNLSQAITTPVTIDNLTDQGQQAYQTYQQGGGTLDVAGWYQLQENQQLQTEQVFGKVFPQQSIDEVLNYIDTNPEGFLTDIRAIGRTPDTEALLKELNPGITEDQMSQIFGETTQETVSQNVSTAQIHIAQIPQLATFWNKVNQIAGKVMEYGFYPITALGMLIWNSVKELRTGEAPVNVANMITTPQDLTSILKVPSASEEIKSLLPGGVLYQEYENLPTWQRLIYEAPGCALVATTIPSALSLIKGLTPVAEAGGIKGAAAIAAQVALTPVAGYEQAVNAIIQLPVKAISVGASKVLQTYIDNNAKYIATIVRADTASLNPIERILQKVFAYHNRYMSMAADAVLKAQMAASRGATTEAGAALENQIYLLNEGITASTETMNNIVAATQAGKELTTDSLAGLIVKNTPADFIAGITDIVAGKTGVATLSDTLLQEMEITQEIAKGVPVTEVESGILRYEKGVLKVVIDLNPDLQGVRTLLDINRIYRLGKVSGEDIYRVLDANNDPLGFISGNNARGFADLGYEPFKSSLEAINKANEVTTPKAEAGMPEAGLQTGIPGMAAAETVRPQPMGKLVQTKIDDYLRLREYNTKATMDRIAEIKKALETKGRTELGLKGNLRVELARLEALQEVDAVKNIADLDSLIKDIQTELGNRELPFQGQGGKSRIDLARHPTQRLFKGYTTKQLDEMLKVYQQARQTMEPEVPAVSPIRAEDISADMPAITNTQLTPIQVQKTLALFKEAIAAPSAERQRVAALELRKHVFAERASLASGSAQAMIVEGMNPEEAIRAAEQMFMTGKLPDLTTDYFDDLTQEMKNVLFAKVYNYWKDKSWAELMSATDALTNALAGKSIPRIKGIGSKYFPDGGSAWDRLARVFVGDMEVLEALDKGKSLSSIIEGVLLQTGRGSVPLDQATVNWLKELSTISEEDKLLLTKPLSEITEADVKRIAEGWFWQRKIELDTLLKEGSISSEEYKLELAIAKDKAFPYKPVTPFEAPITEAFKQLPLLTLREKDTIVRTLKNIRMTAVDIGNFIRANKASCDMSAWRQVMPLVPGNPIEAYRSEVEAWKALFSQASAEANWEWVKRQPSFPYYVEMARQTGQDFLRMLEVPKGTAQWQAAEEFGYLTEERLLPRITAKVPWIKWSGRAFVTKTNTMTIMVYNKCLKAALSYADMIATGKIKLPEGEGFSIQQEMNDYGKAIAWMTQRASLGKLKAIAPEIGGMVFAPRSWLGRLYTPRLLIDPNPRVRRFAWKNLMLFVGVIGGLVMLGHHLGLWDVELDPHSGEFGGIRIGNLRIDPWAGYRQFLVLFTRLITGTGVSSVTGQEYEINPIGALTTFFRNAVAPLLSTFLDFWTGKNFLGEKVDITNFRQWVDRIAPFTVQNELEAFQDSWQHGLMAFLPSFFGANVNVYSGDWTQNWLKLGLPKYPENTGYGITEPIYDLADFWADTASQFRGVDPATLTESKGYPPYVRSIATALQIIDQINLLPNRRLSSLNADPTQGTTFMQYYQMWQDRQKIVASGDKVALTAFDADPRTRDAYLGNLTQAQYALLVEYNSLPDSEKADFLGWHPELYINPREEWLRTHPQENALLALWGKADVYSIEALSQVSSLAKSLGIPENALMMKDLDAVAELKLKNQHLFDLLDAYGGLDDTFKGPDGLTARDRAIKALYADNPEFRDDTRRIDALNVGTKDNPTPETMVEGWVERGQIADKFGPSSAEMKLWLIDNKEVHQWALENGLLTDTGEKWNENILRLQVSYKEDFDKYENYGDSKSPLYIANDTARANARDAMLFDKGKMTSFGTAYYTISALQKEIPDNLVTTYVDYYGIRKREGVDYSAGWYDDDWFLMAHPDFYYAMFDLGIWTLPEGFDTQLARGYLALPTGTQRTEFRIAHPELNDLLMTSFSKVPTRQVYNLYQQYLALPTGTPRMDFRLKNPSLDDWLVLAKGYKPAS
jgi:hypothetical protein